MSEDPLTSFVVIAYNEAANIGRTLDAITSLAGLGRYEVIVVNDGSRDRTAGIVADVADRNPHVRLIDLDRNRGRGYARSKGIAAARGDLIATVDADIILPPDWLIRARAALGRYDADAVGGTAVPDGDAAYLHKRFKLAPRVVGHSTAVTGSNALYRRRVFDLAGFDPALREGEDVALNHATQQHGLSFATVPGLLVQHIEGKTLRGSLTWLYVSGRGATRQLASYGRVRPPDLAAGAFAGAAIAGLFMTLRGKRLAGASIPAAVVLAASTAHVRSRFETPRTQWRRVVPAVAVDGLLLTAYFTGRLTGLAGLWRHLPRTASRTVSGSSR
jgi:GT2 family glycosyltransferase